MRRLVSLAIATSTVFTLGSPVALGASVDRTTAVRPSARTVRVQTKAQGNRRLAEWQLKRFQLSVPQRISSAGVSFLSPSTWKKESGVDRPLTQDNLTFHVALFAPKKAKDVFHENINLVTEDLSRFAGMTLDRYTELGLNAERKLFQSFHELGRQRTTVSGHPADSVHFLATVNDTELEFRQVWFLKGNTAYIWTYAADANDAVLHADLFDAMIKTVIVD